MNLVQFIKSNVMNVGCIYSGEIYYIENDELHEEIFTEFVTQISSCKVIQKNYPEYAELFEVSDQHGILMRGMRIYEKYIGFWNSSRVQLFHTKEEMIKSVYDRYANDHVMLYNEEIQLTYCTKQGEIRL